MQNYIDRTQSHTKSGKIQLENYTIGTLKKYQIDDLLLENTCSREDTKKELQKKLANTTNLEEFLKLAKELGEENLTDEQKRILTLWETAEGIKNGVYKAGKEFVKGLFDFVLHPVKTIESTIDALAHPIETFDYLSMAIRDSYERDVINGDATSRAEWFSYALGSIGLSAVGTKGLGAVSKTGMATTKVATKAGASKVKGAAQKISGLDLLPYAPRNQLAYANVGVVPYNVVDGARTRDQLISMVKISKGKKLSNRPQFTKVDGKKVLKPDIEYTTNEGYQYKTDIDGRISSVEAKLQLGKADRNQYAQRTVGGKDRLPNDDGGHLIASIFKGSGDIDNLVPMNATLNRSEYKTLENTWRKAIEEGKEVTIKVKPIYDKKSHRPSEFKINYSIDGKKYSERLTNYVGGK